MPISVKIKKSRKVLFIQIYFKSAPFISIKENTRKLVDDLVDNFKVSKCNVFRDLLPFVQFKKGEKHP